MAKRRYAIVGTGIRSEMYLRALLEDFRDSCELVALCDTNRTRMEYWKRTYARRLAGDLPLYDDSDFEKMVRERKVDEIIVTSIDRTHHTYICQGMELGCDAITEKPMTIDVGKCREILDAIQRTGRRLRVAFNYRYAPRNAKVKEILAQGAIGNVFSVHFEWMLNTKHGADYFRRWHRQKTNSGGLMVHKATHHFDLVNWWLGSHPEVVSAMGGLRFYGKTNADKRGQKTYLRGTDEPDAAGDPFALNLRKDERLKGLYLDAEHEDGYVRDRCVFSDGIDIEDDVGVLARYANQAVMSYHLTAYSPWEGYRVMFNGSEGRLELEVVESSYVSGSAEDHNARRKVSGGAPAAVEEPATLLLRPHWKKMQSIDLPSANQGGHGGGDALLLHDLFTGVGDDPLGRAATHVDGTLSILTGIAANRSLDTDSTIRIEDLIGRDLAANDMRGNGQPSYNALLDLHKS